METLDKKYPHEHQVIAAGRLLRFYGSIIFHNNIVRYTIDALSDDEQNAGVIKKYGKKILKEGSFERIIDIIAACKKSPEANVAHYFLRYLFGNGHNPREEVVWEGQLMTGAEFDQQFRCIDGGLGILILLKNLKL